MLIHRGQLTRRRSNGFRVRLPATPFRWAERTGAWVENFVDRNFESVVVVGAGLLVIAVAISVAVVFSN